MKIVQLTPTARARVWFGAGIPEFSPSGTVRAAVEGEPSVAVAIPYLTLEALVARGARAEYGLVGVRFDTATDTLLRVEVPYSGENGQSWSASLGSAVDDVHLGLPREYADAILDAVVVYAARRFPPGTIKIVQAAHGLVGSNARFFRTLATCVLELMENDYHRSDDQTITLLRRRMVD